MDTKVCECKALGMISELMAILEVWDPGDKSTNRRILTITKQVHNHLDEELSKNHNESIRSVAEPVLKKMKQTIGESEFGDKLPIYALEEVRNAIHQYPVLQQIMVCGAPVSNQYEMKEAAQVIGAALIVDAAIDSSAAKTIVDIYSDAQGCNQPR